MVAVGCWLLARLTDRQPPESAIFRPRACRPKADVRTFDSSSNTFSETGHWKHSNATSVAMPGHPALGWMDLEPRHVPTKAQPRFAAPVLLTVPATRAGSPLMAGPPPIPACFPMTDTSSRPKSEGRHGRGRHGRVCRPLACRSRDRCCRNQLPCDRCVWFGQGSVLESRTEQQVEQHLHLHAVA
jgi:hypothetical protein